MAEEKNSFTYSIMITVPLTIALNKMPGNTVVPELWAAGEGDIRRTRVLSMSAIDREQECGDNCSFKESVGWNRVMPKLWAKFEQYEKEDQEAGAVRSFIRHMAKRREENCACRTPELSSRYRYKIKHSSVLTAMLSHLNRS